MFLDNKIEMCLRCHKKDFPENTMFCTYCSTPLINTCTSNECGKINDPYSWYCQYCGAPTLFNENGLLQETQNED